MLRHMCCDGLERDSLRHSVPAPTALLYADQYSIRVDPTACFADGCNTVLSSRRLLLVILCTLLCLLIIIAGLRNGTQFEGKPYNGTNNGTKNCTGPVSAFFVQLRAYYFVVLATCGRAS